MAVDVSPEILEEIEKNFEEYYKDPNVKRIYKKIVDGTATYSDMQILSGLVAKHIYQSTEKAYTNALDSGKLPNDKLYQNIVDKTMRPTLKDGHGLIVEACGDVQTDLNRKSGIKLNAVEPVLNENKVSGLIYQITNTNETRLSRTVLSGLIDNFCRSVVDDFVHANLDFQKESGFSPQISRTRGPNSNSRCEYCAALVYTGEYKGPSMPEEIFRRHRYCHCNVLYNPMNGKKLQDVWSKREYQDYREAEQKQRQYLNELDKMTPTERRLARNARARELRRAKYTPQEWERRKALEAEIAEGKGLSKALPLEERKAYKGFKVSTPETGLTAQKRIAYANNNSNGIIRAIDIDDLNTAAYGKNIKTEVVNFIYSEISKLERKGGFVFSDIYVGELKKEKGRTVVLQTEMLPNGLLRLGINTDAVAGRTIAELDAIFADADGTVCNNFRDAMVHESGHAKLIKGKTPKQVEDLYKQLEDRTISGVSDRALVDGAEGIAEVEVLLERGENVPDEALELYKEYMK